MKCIGSKLVSRLKSMNKVYSLFKKKKKKEEKDNYIRGLKFDCHVKLKSVKYIMKKVHISNLLDLFFFFFFDKKVIS